MEIEKLEQANQGRVATLVSNHLKPYLDQHRKHVIDELKTDFRSGKSDHLSLLTKVSSLCVLDDLENRLKQHINRGETVSKELEQDGTRS